VNVILCGDFHQFPPVVGGKRAALWYPLSSQDNEVANIGKQIYDQFRTVVILKDQVRVTDPIWHDFLQHLRRGMVQDHHIEMIKRLSLLHDDVNILDFTHEPWSSSCLVTPRHVVRQHWNEEALYQHCMTRHHTLFQCPSTDTIRGRSLTMMEQLIVANQSVKKIQLQ